MRPNYPKPSWRPTIVPPLDWTIERLREYLNGKHFSVFKNGSCVVWPENGNLSNSECQERLLSVVTHHPDFKVREHRSGDFLVTFQGGVGGVMLGEILRENISILREEAYSKGLLHSEILHNDDTPSVDDAHIVAGLYVRARLYLDVEAPVVVSVM